MNLLDNDLEQNNKSKRPVILIGVVSVVILTIAPLIYFFVLPKHGDQVNPPKRLEDAIRSQLKKEGKSRAVSRMTYFYCTNTSLGNMTANKQSYSVLVELDKQRDPANGYVDFDYLFKVRAIENEDLPTGWELMIFNNSLLKLNDKSLSDPCVLR